MQEGLLRTPRRRLTRRGAPATLGLLALGLAACSDGGSGGSGGSGGGNGGAEPVQRYASGTRLQARALRDGEGVDVFRDFFDTELGVACTFLRTAEGELRCLPPRRSDVRAVFADAACTAPAIVNAACSDGGFVTVFDGTDCEDFVALEVFQSSGAPAQGIAHVGDAERCTERQENGDVLTDATRVPLDRFVRGVEEAVEVEGELSVLRIVGEDGSQQVTGLARGGAPCTPILVEGAYRCLGGATVAPTPTEFADASCTASAAKIDGCTRHAPSLVVEAEPTSDACDFVPLAVYEVGPALSRVYASDGASCQLLEDPGGGFDHYAIGAPLTMGALPAVEEVELGTGRLRVTTFGHDGAPLVGKPLRPLSTGVTYFDTELSTRCAPYPATDGTLRCLPTSYAGYAPFADDACSVQLFSANSDAACGEAPDSEPLMAISLVEDALGCQAEGAYEVRRRGAAFTGPTYFLNDVTGECTAAGEVTTAYEIGEVMPPSAFAALTLGS